MSARKKRILVTGGAGFIGSHLSEALVKAGHQVSIIDNLSTGSLTNIEHLMSNPRFSATIDTIMNNEVLESLVLQCDEVYHLAAAVGVKLIMERPVETIETNVAGTERVLQLANKHKRKVLITSSSEIYGKQLENNGHAQPALHEDDDRLLGAITKRRWAYACSKALDEFLALAYYEEKKLPVVIVRLFNTVGPRQTAQYGMVIPNFVQRALLDKELIVFGDGDQSRSFVDVSDAVKALILLMENKKATGQIFNVGNGAEVSINDLAKKVVKLTGSRSRISRIPYEKAYGPGFEDMRRRVPDIDRVRKLTGYEPLVDLDGILLSVIEHFKQ
jgi:UDP-glucose 4-epimerase